MKSIETGCFESEYEMERNFAEPVHLVVNTTGISPRTGMLFLEEVLNSGTAEEGNAALKIRALLVNYW